MRKRTIGLLAFAGAAAGGVAMGYLAERRRFGAQRPTDDPEWLELATSPPGRRITVEADDGTALVATVFGEDGRPTVVLAHGYGLSSRFWHYQCRDLTDELRVVAYDQRGHGASQPAVSRDYSPRALATDLRAVLDATVPAKERSLVVGHSMGGMSLLAFADAYPDAVAARLAGAVIVNSAASKLIAGSLWSTGIAALGALEERFSLLGLGRRVPAGGVTSDLGYLLTRALSMHPGARPAHVAFVEQLLIDAPTDVKAALGTTLGTLDLSEALAHLVVPTLVVAGEHDRLTPLAQSEALVAALPDAELVVVEGAGHHAPLEAHEAVTGHLRAHAGRVLTAHRGGSKPGRGRARGRRPTVGGSG